MAFIVDHGQQSNNNNNNYKHFCKICKKGFMCGRALGGHMRAHGIGDDLNHMDDDDDDTPSDWDEPNNNDNNNKRMYALRANPNRLKNYSNCEHCGKEFSSWKLYFEHGRCTASDDAESLVSSPPGSDDEAEYKDDVVEARKPGWSKRKRSTRAKIDGHDHTTNKNNNNVINNNNNLLYRPSSEEEDLANCLMMLSSATIDRSAVATEPEESCASASKDEDFIHRQNNNNIVNFVTSAPPNNNNNNNVNISYHRVLDKAKGVATTSHNNNNNNNKNGMFECKACKKVFNSHQALGGHRASHKKVKGCFASRLDNNDDNNNNNLVRGDHDHDVMTAQAHEDQFFHSKTLSSLTFDHGTNPMSSKRKSKVHECSICHRIFSSGQALGGHKRCHWITSNSADPSSLAKQFQQFHHQIEQIQQNNTNDSPDQPLNLNLNLNLPAPNRFQVPTDMYLQSWLRANNEEGKNDMMNKNVVNNSNIGYVDDEADSKVKLAKLSDLKDMNVNGTSSPWLQVGIGSTSERVGSDP